MSNSLYGCHEKFKESIDLFQETEGIHAKFYVGDALDLNFEANAFDSCISALVLMHVPDPKKMIAEAYRVLKPGARAAFSVVSPKTNSLDWLSDVFPEE